MNEKILVVEDDPSTLRFLQYTLEVDGYQVLMASNGLQGLRKARTEVPDLVILDVMLPGMDGFDICHRLRGQPETAHLPILMFSAKAQEIDRDTGLNLGANDYIIKPADSSKILRQVRRLLVVKPAANDRVSS